MAQIARSVATLRVGGDNLIPAEITKLLGCNPTSEQTKGQKIVGKVTGEESIAPMGVWRIEVADRVPENLDGQISELLDKLTPDLKVWRSISSRFKIDIFVGLFMNVSNEGLEISAESSQRLGERGIVLALNIYDPCDD